MHISLDFWNTIGIPNRDYAKARNELLAKWFGYGEPLTPERAGEIYASVKETIDRTHSADCRPLDFSTCYYFLNQTMENEDYFSEYSVGYLRIHLEKLFRQHPPTILPETKLQLEHLSKIATLSIGSNTNFIRGAVISEFLPDVFKFKIFSDELGYAKPHAKFWEAVEKEAPCGTIFHVGDHPVCDMETPKTITSILVKNPTLLPSVLSRF